MERYATTTILSALVNSSWLAEVTSETAGSDCLIGTTECQSSEPFLCKKRSSYLIMYEIIPSALRGPLYAVSLPAL